MNEQDIDELGDFAEAYARGISRGERWPFGYPTIHQVMAEQTIRLGSVFRAPDVMLIDGLPTYGTVTYRGPSAGYGFDVRPVLDPRKGVGLLALVVSG
jgi:hypothetical protein